MKRFQILSFLLLLLFAACNNYKQGISNTDNIEKNEIDTAKALEEMQIVEKQKNLYLMENDLTLGLKKGPKTIDLMYIPYSCDCPSWVFPEEYEKVDEHNNKFERVLTEKEFEHFDVLEFAYYIEPASIEIEIPCYLKVNRNVIRLIGREYNEIGYPENFQSPDPHAPKGKVFRYYGYEIIKPYRVWGPKVFDSVCESTGDSMFTPSILYVK